ncbi:MAG: bifunctional heptose 7-phosphate kinase/heptose 1-phosphate adenyltransferase [Gammaproteobacteria bacterium]|nr:bifunctional heptose 7-phosphate kinase/heptose 1-phosphate adenyltransferase [Gammaproteobacteria bacterium]
MRLPRFDAARVVVAGDVMLDRYWSGDTSRVSAEAPIPVVHVADIEDRLGGAGNVALNVAALGAVADLVGAVGEDEYAAPIAAKLESAGIGCHLHTQAYYRTITKLRIVSRKQQLVRADFENHAPIDQGAITELVDSALQCGADMLLLSDYDKGVLEDPQRFIALAQQHGVPVAVDPKHKDFGVYAGATVIKPNRFELAHAMGEWQTEAELVEKCQTLIRNLGVNFVLVTRGSAGMTLVQPNQAETHFPARTRDVYDVTGAGDTVIAVLSSALGAGETLLDAVGFANIAAGMVVAQSGTAVVSGTELRLEVAVERGFDRGVMTEEQMVIALDEARARGERIVFTNGCFDILHAGHVDYLTEARREGDRLIVAVNDDLSVARLKGEGRPINPIDRRMALLSGLEAVDWVLPFGGDGSDGSDTPLALLERLRPDVLVKGGDYALDEVVGAEIVTGYGGDVKVMSIVDGSSTSAIVEKIRRL